MKRAFYKYFRNEVFRRWEIIQLKKKIRKAAIQWSINYLKEWDHIPVSYLVGDICEKLQIQRTSFSISFVFNLKKGIIDIPTAEKLINLPQNLNIK